MISKSTEETSKIAKLFLAKLLKKNGKQPGALVVGLSGNLGAGKTAFTQAVAKHLGIKHKITSPTFVIMKKYLLPLPGGSARRARGSDYEFLFHFDAYRLQNEKELTRLGWEEIISHKKHLVFIEWPEKIAKAMPAGANYIYFSHLKNDQRNLILK